MTLYSKPMSNVYCNANWQIVARGLRPAGYRYSGNIGGWDVWVK